MGGKIKDVLNGTFRSCKEDEQSRDQKERGCLGDIDVNGGYIKINNKGGGV